MKIIKRHLDKSEYTRSKIPLERVTGIVIHFTDSATTTFSRNAEWLYEFLNYNRPARQRHASYHYAIDQDGATYEFIPPNECAWHAGPTNLTRPNITETLNGRPNWSTIGISFLHPSPDGKPTPETYQSLVELTVELCNKFKINEDNVFRHFDCTGKDCPRYFVNNEQEWVMFKTNVKARLFINSGGV